MCKLVLQIHFTYNITWLFSVVLVSDITWCICYRDYGLHFGGGVLFFCLCTTTYVCISLILVVYILVIFSCNMFYILYAYFFVHISPSYTFYQLCEIYPQLDENFWGVYAYMFYHMQLYVYSELCLLKYKLFYMISQARTVVVSMLDIDNVCVLACHSICILFCMCQVDIVCHFSIWSSFICISFDT